MKSYHLICIILLFLCLFTSTSRAATFMVNSLASFNQAQSNAGMNDSIIWESGTYSNVYMNITKDHLFIAAAELGKTIFEGTSRVRISGDHITFQGFQYVGGNIGSHDVINIYGSDLLIHQINIRAYTCYKYLRIREESQYVTVSYCNFENRLNLDDQNILSILVSATQPGYHKIQHCSFKNFDGIGKDMGIEPIRIGLSSQADRISRSLVEYCYFTHCDGDGELISSKARQNVYRYNTFENNSKAELVLRHGSEAIVYGNFFLKGKGGIRVREGQNHYIYNNYFQELNDRSIYLQNDDSDPLDSIMIAFNTIVDCSEMRLGGVGSYKPTHVMITNNIFADPNDDVFQNPTGTETWIGNIVFGDLGMSLPASGIIQTDPLLEENREGFWGLSANSPAIDAAQSGYLMLPQFGGMDSIDSDILMDLMGQTRPSTISDKDLGCNEYPHNILIQPIATEDNTGPSYNSSSLNSIESNQVIVDDLFQVFPNPANEQITIKLANDYAGLGKVEVYDVLGNRILVLLEKEVSPGRFSFTKDISKLATGTYHIKGSIRDQASKISRVQHLMFIKQ